MKRSKAAFGLASLSAVVRAVEVDSLLEETNASGVALADYIYLNGRPVAVFNYSLSTLEQGAAAARFMKSPLTQLKKYGLGNDPHKNDMIRQGMQYKQNDCGHF